jgi:hypothetical protein
MQEKVENQDKESRTKTENQKHFKRPHLTKPKVQVSMPENCILS